ncbi:lipopolysaccharide assembly protein LapB [Thiohalomonas denitrificans]|uniref:Lipopolysaccharide assembly protein B n=1 Tax=Thiohalomonas denitrificans TaxID=415747 RepID=A0A1G5PI42_9GAMM|nr:lipopolysaccharide assembly protein LapB [Thiohalomonas denitrificans]SCZ49192.1 Lipopolysaccharide biosynthesis regulator YciM, contains six TPR domains and a predicted metal-binding C-terminal domain [Thiohalomonas denitrificans]
MMLELLFLLLPVAAYSGWWTGSRSRGKKLEAGDTRFSAAYFKGLNFLLNEQPDKAIEVFVHMLEVDSETVETHFALGNLFLRRGEVDRAIRIHQNLIARPTLTREQRNQALFELGRDYMRAGLLDRAESLFLELMEDGNYGSPSLQQLIDIYQQEKEWERAIHTARRLDGRSGKQMRPTIAHFYCELAEAELGKGSSVQAQKMVKKALSEDKNCVRASLIEGRLLLNAGSPKAALKAYKRVEQQDPDYLPEVSEPVQICYSALQRPSEATVFLKDVLQRHGSASIALALVEQLQKLEGEERAVDFLTDYLEQHPSVRGMSRLIELKVAGSGEVQKQDFKILHTLVDNILTGKPVYKCGHCGFNGRTLHWQCPGCKHWSTIKPIHGVEGE